MGVFVGLIIALIYAPEAGEELHMKILHGMKTNFEKANLELERLNQTIQEKNDQPKNQKQLPAT